MRFVAAFGALTLVLAALSSRAVANGRFPESERLLEHPSDPNRLYLTGTWGMLLTEDRGRNWYYVCESSFALEYVEGDPLLEVLPGGELVGGIRQSLNTSTDCGCSWSPHLAEPEPENVFDVSLGSDGTLVALVQDITTLPTRFRLFESADRGATWQHFSDLPEDVLNGYTVDIAPSDPTRLYVSATSTTSDTGSLLVSMDRGENWDTFPIPSTSTRIHPFIAAVSPTDPDVVYVRTDDWDTSMEIAAQDALLVTTDAGENFEEILRLQAKLLGFAVSPDGSMVLAGYGDTVTTNMSVSFDDFGIYKASTADHTFGKILDKMVTCLRWTENGVYACLAHLTDVPSPDLALGFAPNADFTLADPNPLTPLLDTKLVKGPLACTGAVCAETWSEGLEGNPAVCLSLRADCEAELPTDALTCPMDPGGDGGDGGEAGSGGSSGGTGGTAGSAGSGGAPAGGANGGTPTGGSNASGGAGQPSGGTSSGSGAAGSGNASNGEGGCGCRHASSQTSRTALALALLASCAAVYRRSRRRV
jgi:hypothetical protein